MDKKWILLTTNLLNYSSTHLAAISGTVLNYDGSRFESQGLKFYYSGKCDNINNGKPYSPSLLTTYLKHYSSSELIWGASAALTLYNKKIFNQVGGFDEDFFAYLEDVDLSFRLNNAGYETLYLPQAISYHLGGGTTSSMGNFRQKQTVKNWIYIILKNYSSTQLLTYFPSIFIERLRNLSGLIKNTPVKYILRDVFKTYFEVIRTIPKILKKRYRPTEI